MGVSMAWVWDDGAFCRRVVRRCEELGRSAAEVLEEAGITHDYLQTTAKRGRRIDRLGRLASVLGMEVGELLGLPPLVIDSGVLLRAYRAAVEIVGDGDEGEVVRVMAAVYRALCVG